MSAPTVTARGEIALPISARERRPQTTNYHPTILFGWVVILLAFGGFAAWSVYAPLATTVVASGTVTVAGNTKTIQHLEGGTVKQILVDDGSDVAAGQVLVRLDDTQARANLALLQGQYDAVRAAAARLLAERDGRDAITFPADLVARRGSSNDVREILTGQQGIFDSRRTTLQGQVSILLNRIEQSKAQIAGLQLQEDSKAKQEALINQELRGLNQLHAKGYASGNQVLAFEREAARLHGERGAVMAQIATVRQGIGEANLQILQMQKAFRESTEKDLRDAQTKVYDLAERLHAAQDMLDHMTVRAPVGGTVVNMSLHTVGGVVAPGGHILDIVPNNQKLIVEADVRPNDIDGVHPGLPADIRFSAFDRNTTPVIDGKVIFVSADRLIAPRTEMPYYLVKVQVTEAGAENMRNMKLMPGMPAEVMINKGKRTLLDYLTSPLSDTLARAFSE